MSESPIHYDAASDMMQVELRPWPGGEGEKPHGGQDAGPNLVIHYAPDGMPWMWEIEDASQHPELITGALAVMRSGQAVCTPAERRKNLAASIVPEPIGENDEGSWEWCSLWEKNTGLPFKIWLCDIAPVVILGEHFPARAEINQLYRWMQLNDEVLENLGLYDTMETLRRLRKLPQ